MKEFIIQYWPEFVGGIVAIAGAIVGIINAIYARKFAKYLDDAKRRETYIVCPRCKKHVSLSEIQFHLPSGQLDNNLDGLPD